MKFAPNVKGETKGVTYANVKEVIVQHIQQSFKHGYEIAKAIEDLQTIKIQEPQRSISLKQDTELKRIEQDGFDIK